MRIYYRKAVFLLLLITFLPSLAQAKTCCCEKITVPLCVSPTQHLPSWYMDAGLGWVFNQKLGTSYLANADEKEDQYNPPKVNKVATGSLSGGYVWSHPKKWLPFTSLGLEYSYYMPAKVKGVIEENSDPEMANLNYKYKIAHHNLQLIGKADIFRWKNFMPYVSGGAGVSWNRVSDYREEQSAEGQISRTYPEFGNKTKLNFSYSLGTGVDYVFTRNLWGGLGYRFDHFGWEKTGDTTSDKFLDKNLKNTSKAHTILFSLRYLFA